MTNESSKCCPLCGGAKHPGEISFTVDLDSGVVVVRHVPAQVCDQCGESWLEDAVAERLENFVKEARAKHPVVEVAEWNSLGGVAA